MQSQRKIEDLGVDSPSFSYYYSDTLTIEAVTKVIHEEHSARLKDFDQVEGEDFEFSFVLDVIDHEAKAKDDKKIDVSVSINSSLRKLLVDEELFSSSYSSSSSEEEANKMDNIRSSSPQMMKCKKSSSTGFCIWRPKLNSGSSSPQMIPSGRFCIWRPKLNSGSSSPQMMKCKKSSSTGSRSKRWSIRYLFKRSNSECNVKPMALLSSNKKVDSPKHKVAGQLKVQSPVHEQFYVQRRAENESVKRKTFLPYRQNLVGLFANVNGMGKVLPF